MLPPNPPTYVRATRAGATATVSWQPPTPNGGSPVSGYRVVLQPGGAVRTTAASARTVQLNGLAAGTDYTVQVAATSAVGRSRSSTVTTKVRRLTGADRVATAVSVSRASYPSGGASAVVLVAGGHWSDALAAGPLAVVKHAPVLLTSTGSVPRATMSELARVLPEGRTVYLLGGTGVISDDVRQAVVAKGFQVRRLAGSTPAGTARVVANVVANASTVSAVFEVSSQGWADAWAATPAAVRSRAVMLLTNGTSPAPETTAWLSHHRGVTRYAVGAAAHQADPAATALVGTNAQATSLAVAAKFFSAPKRVGLVATARFVPGLVEATRLGRTGPLLYAVGGGLSTAERGYLRARRTGIATVELTGGALPYYDVESATQASLVG